MAVCFGLPRGMLVWWRAAWAVFSHTTALRSAAAEHKHSLDVPGHGDEAPLAANLVEAAQQELAESHHRFDDAKHRFRGLLARTIDFFALRCPQTPSHDFERCRIFRRRR